MLRTSLEQNQTNISKYPYNFNKKIVHDIDQMVTIFAEKSFDLQLIKRKEADFFGFYGDCDVTESKTLRKTINSMKKVRKIEIGFQWIDDNHLENLREGFKRLNSLESLSFFRLEKLQRDNRSWSLQDQ